MNSATKGPIGTVGFTLIELLVVITVIVVLLALLAPALDQAVYQAELAVCAARQKGVIGGIQVYAADQRRFYSDRKLDGSETWDWPQVVCETINGYDLRPQIQGYIDLKLLFDPLSKFVDISPQRTEPNGIAFGDYSLWFGYGYSGEERFMRRLGDTWTESLPDEAMKQQSFTLMTQCEDFGEEQGVPSVYSSHPDKDAKMPWIFLQSATLGPTYTKSRGSNITYGYWTLNSLDRGAIDKNAGFSDGSVALYRDQTTHTWKSDASVVRVRLNYAWPRGSVAGAHNFVPRR